MLTEDTEPLAGLWGLINGVTRIINPHILGQYESSFLSSECLSPCLYKYMQLPCSVCFTGHLCIKAYIWNACHQKYTFYIFIFFSLMYLTILDFRQNQWTSPTFSCSGLPRTGEKRCKHCRVSKSDQRPWDRFVLWENKDWFRVKIWQIVLLVVGGLWQGHWVGAPWEGCASIQHLCFIYQTLPSHPTLPINAVPTEQGKHIRAAAIFDTC